MVNRCKRRSILILLFSIQILLLSCYTFLHYQNGETNVQIVTSDPVASAAHDDALPADIIEKTNRSALNENYRRPQINKLRVEENSLTLDKIQSLNISFVKDVDQQQTIVQCSLLPTNLVGRVEADLFSYTLEEIEEHHANLSIQLGGHWSPLDCTARYRVAIIIPYRDRDMQLRIFLNFMHPFLQKQQLDYQIFLIEPVSTVTFNRALLFNIGYQEVMKHYAWQCLVFHDVDLIPEDDRNVYSCPPEPRHMSVAVNTMDYKLPYRTIFGGVSALTIEQFKSINGYSNQFFGWGGEDDDMAARVLTKYRISRYPAEIARYKMLRHRPDTPNRQRFKTLQLSSELRSIDGLSNLQYTMIKTTKEKLYTHIQVTYNETAIRSGVAHIKRRPVKGKKPRI